MKIKIICTLGPKSINKDFLKFTKNKISMLRLNMSHLNLYNLKKSIKFIKKNTKIPICIDTEGAQIRTKVRKEKFLKLGKKITINNNKGDIKLYPDYVFKQINKNDILNIGFNNLKIKVIKKKKNILCKVISSGKIENNKGVHLVNRKIKLNYLTEKDFKAIQIGKKFKINNYALSFTNSINDITKFNKVGKMLRKGHRQAGFVVLKSPDVPSVLVEMGFLSNKIDEKKLNSIRFQEKIADTIIDSIEIYFDKLD